MTSYDWKTASTVASAASRVTASPRSAVTCSVWLETPTTARIPSAARMAGTERASFSATVFAK